MSQKIIFAFIIVREKNPLYGMVTLIVMDYGMPFVAKLFSAMSDSYLKPTQNRLGFFCTTESVFH